MSQNGIIMTVKKNIVMDSRHYVEKRRNREAFISTIGLGRELITIEVDKNHPKGPELHTITSTGIIVVRNKASHKIVTKLIARPGQIRRYFDEIPEIIEKVIEVARIHQKMGYNYE